MVGGSEYTLLQLMRSRYINVNTIAVTIVTILNMSLWFMCTCTWPNLLDTPKKYYSSGETVQSSRCRLCLKICDVPHVKMLFRSSNASILLLGFVCLIKSMSWWAFSLMGWMFAYFDTVIKLLSQKISLSLKRNHRLLGADYKMRVVSAIISELLALPSWHASNRDIVYYFDISIHGKLLVDSSSQLALLGKQKLPIRLM